MTKVLREFIEFIENPKAKDKVEKFVELENKLINLWQYCNTLESSLQKDAQCDSDYEENRKMLSVNFPELKLYNDTTEISEKIGDTEVIIGDSLDDLTDIVLDVKDSLSFQSEKDTESHLRFSFETHFKNHMINLLRYLNYFL